MDKVVDVIFLVSHYIDDNLLQFAGLPVLEPDLRPPMHSIEEQFEIRSIETAMENGTTRYVVTVIDSNRGYH